MCCYILLSILLGTFAATGAKFNDSEFNGYKDVSIVLYAGPNYTPIRINLENILQDSTIVSKYFNKHVKTVIFISGFDSQSSTFKQSILNGYSGFGFEKVYPKDPEFNDQNRKVNLIGVNWKLGYNGPVLAAVHERVKKVGEFVALNLIKKLMQTGLVTDLSELEMVAYCVGCHIAGFAGKCLMNSEMGSMSKITALDPAAPGFTENIDDSARLNAADAQYVMVIHTNGETLGLYEALGHVDIYLNGGKRQPICVDDYSGACSHAFSHEFFAYMINVGPLYAFHCSNILDLESLTCTDGRCVKVRFASTIPPRNGIYYLDTNLPEIRTSVGNFIPSKHIIYEIFTPENPIEPLRMKNLEKISDLGHFLNKRRKTVVFIDGFKGEAILKRDLLKAYFGVKQNERDARFRMKNVNLIRINWNIGYQQLTTALSQSMVQTVAYHTAAFIRRSIEENVLKRNNLEIVGHSLGAHIAGNAGKFLKHPVYMSDEPLFEIPSIIGLDPAKYNGIENLPATHRLSTNDGERVIVIHSNNVYGLYKQQGTIDIYLDRGDNSASNDIAAHLYSSFYYAAILNLKQPLTGIESPILNAETPVISSGRKIKLFAERPFPSASERKVVIIYTESSENNLKKLTYASRGDFPDQTMYCSL